MALRYLLDENLRGPLWAALDLVALPCPIPQLLEALFYYAEDPADNLWRDQITFIP